ncbi:MAG: radical SAM protein [Oligoflexales bacterium]|nr:radical SAM protein [Oligoflexales bacterium]
MFENCEDMRDMPVILRREAFGGIIFDPVSATQIELDKEAYDFAVPYLWGEARPLNLRQYRLAKSLGRLIDIRKKRKVAERDFCKEGFPGYGFPVFSSPTLADFQITSACDQMCPHCYASSTQDGMHVGLSDIELVLNELSQAGVCQLAVGGGEPLSHPDIHEILRLSREKGIISNLTTNSSLLSEDMIPMLRNYCGAVGLSMEGVGRRFEERRRLGFERFRHCALRLIEAGIPLVIQVTLSRENFDELSEIVRFCQSLRGLYGVIFLAYKAVGRGKSFNSPLSVLLPSSVYISLRDAFVTLSRQTRVGYDCCLTPGIVGIDEEFEFGDQDLLEGCSALRGSIGISTGLDVIPCTFLPRQKLGNLREEGLSAIWNGSLAQSFRKKMDKRRGENQICSGCRQFAGCLGGCPEMDLVNCHRNYLSLPRSPEAHPCQS